MIERCQAMALRDGGGALLAGSGATAAAPYFPPPEAEGGWRSLVPVNDEPSPAQKQAVVATAGLCWWMFRQKIFVRI